MKIAIEVALVVVSVWICVFGLVLIMAQHMDKSDFQREPLPNFLEYVANLKRPYIGWMLLIGGIISIAIQVGTAILTRW